MYADIQKRLAPALCGRSALMEMGDKPRSELLGGLQRLYQSRDYSDLIILGSDGSRHPVHRAIVCPRSEYFDNAVKEMKWRDGKEGEIALLDDEPEVVRLLVEYLYLLDYEPLVLPSAEYGSSHGDSSDNMSMRTEAEQYLYGTSALSAFGGPSQAHFPNIYRSRVHSALTIHALPESGFHGTFGRPENRRRQSNRGSAAAPPEPSPLATTEPSLVIHAQMYTAGHKYGISGLKALALDKFKIQLTRHWDDQEFAEAIHIVYDTTPSCDKDMREVVADTLGSHSQLLDKPEIEFAIMDINGLAYELLKRSRRAEPE